MNTITLPQALRMLDELSKVDGDSCILISVDTTSSFDIIKEYAFRKSRNDGSIRVRYSRISGHIEPQHKVLLDTVLEYGLTKFEPSLFLDEIALYEKEHIHRVFLTKNIKEMGEIPLGFEQYSCSNPEALNVASVMNTLNEHPNAVVAVKIDDEIMEFASPQVASCYCSYIECGDTPYYAEAIASSLTRLDRDARVDFCGWKTYKYADHIEAFSKGNEPGAMDLVLIECVTVDSYINSYIKRSIEK